MKLKDLTPRKNKAQAMVEFAIALPILLMLLYGILEAGRLLFLYSTIVTASRQAVRYGSTTGQGISTGPRYQDCAGIRLAAQKVDFLNAFDDTDIHIYHDKGPNPPSPVGLSETEYCLGGVAVDPTSFNPTSNNQRIVVRIDGDFLPIIPKLVPFISRSSSDIPPDPIVGKSARTVIVAISIQVTIPPPTLPPTTPTFTSSPTLQPSDTATTTPSNTPSPTLQFTLTPSFTPTITLSPTITLTPTITNTPTSTLSPTAIPTGVTGCNSITHGAISRSGNSMTLTINSPVTTPVTIQDVFVVWNNDKGHLAGSDKTLRLQSVSLGGQFWSGNSSAASITIIPSPSASIPNGTSTITFTFHQSYDNPDGTERILINLSTPGCTLFPIQAP